MSKHIETITLHEGQEPEPTTGSRAVPIYQTTSFVFEDTRDAADMFALQKFGSIYTRISNPTINAFEERMASLEGGIGSVATSSGMSAEFLTAAALASSGDSFVTSSAIYGGTDTMFDVSLGRFGIEARFVEGDDLSKGTSDVIITDGFTGNVALKTAEGIAQLMKHFMFDSLKSSLSGKLGMFIAQNPLRSLKSKIDPRRSNGGFFLGLNGLVVKSHGGADYLGFSNAIEFSVNLARSNISKKIQDLVGENI